MKNSKHQVLLADSYEGDANSIPVGLFQIATFPEMVRTKKGISPNKILNTIIFELAGVTIRTKMDAFLFQDGNIIIAHN